MKRNLEEMARRLGGTLSQVKPSEIATGWATDNRGVQTGDLFLAIRGERVDGHQFVNHAIDKGAVAAVVENQVAAPSIHVQDLVSALAKMGKSFREEFNGPVVGITGSAGKTTTKEFVACALSELGPVLKSAGNRNTEYTSPLVWSELAPDHKSAVIEMAMRGFGQVRHLAGISQPNIAVITNIGHSHLEMVGSRDGVARAKAEILEGLSSDGNAVLWREDDFFTYLREKSPAEVISFGFSPEANCRISEWKILSATSMSVRGTCFGKPWETVLPIVGPHNALAASAAILVAHVCGISPKLSAEAIRSIQLPGLRMEWQTLPNGAIALVDAYNASPSSMAFAIETLLAVPRKGRAYVALAAMRELGSIEESAHRELGRAVKNSDLDGAILLGEPMRFTYEEIGEERAQMASSIEDIQAFLSRLEPGDVILIKGSRAYELERSLSAVTGGSSGSH